MSRLTPTRQALETKWYKQVADAKGQLDYARASTSRVRRDFPPSEIPSPDGNFAFSSAIRTENAALREYHRVLRVYTDLVMDGKLPDEERTG